MVGRYGNEADGVTRLDIEPRRLEEEVGQRPAFHLLNHQLHLVCRLGRGKTTHSQQRDKQNHDLAPDPVHLIPPQLPSPTPVLRQNLRAGTECAPLVRGLFISVRRLFIPWSRPDSQGGAATTLEAWRPRQEPPAVETLAAGGRHL